jgi:hypothetical protein
MKANRDEAVTLAAETSHHGGKLVEMADPSKGNKLDMMTACTTTAIKINIAPTAALMTKGKAPTTMMRTKKIQLHVEQREAVAVAETHRRTSRARGVTPHHPHQAAPMAAVAVAA